MDVAELAIPGSYLITPTVPALGRDATTEWFRPQALAAAVGYPLQLTRAVCTPVVRGVVRGLRWADVPPGQGRYATCMNGSVLYVVVDLRVGSLTFGEYAAVELDDVRSRAVYAAEGLGHAFIGLSDEASVVSLCSSAQEPTVERVLDPLDPRLGLPWSNDDGDDPVLMPEDAAAPSLIDALADGLLPRLDDCRALSSERHAPTIAVP